MKDKDFDEWEFENSGFESPEQIKEFLGVSDTEWKELLTKALHYGEASNEDPAILAALREYLADSKGLN